MGNLKTIEKICVSGRTDRGLVRERNEDDWNCLLNEGFVVLADGMGGHRAGNIASREAVSRCCSSIERLMKVDQGCWNSLNDLCSVLRFVIKDASKHVWKMSRKESSCKGMGSTLCCLLFYREYVIRGHVGDSRIYRLREGVLERLTQDDTVVQKLVKEGELNEEDARKSSERHVLTQAIGVSPLITPTLAVDTFEPEDLYLLCSDGLTEHLSDEYMQSILQQEPDLDRATQRLIDAAKMQGGVDNVTAVVVQPES